MEELLWRDHNIFYNVLCFLVTENEKLFDRSDAKLYWKTVFHLSSIFHHLYIGFFAIGLDLDAVDAIEIRTLKQYRLAYLTGWNFAFQTTFLFLAVSYDVLEWSDKHESKLGRLLRFWRDVVFSGLVVPITMFVTGMFWSIYAIDRELVFPTVYDDVVPWWFNHCVHTNIFIIVCLETLLQARRRPVDVKIENICVMTVLISYAVVYYTIYFVSHRWLYQVFGVLTWWQVCLFQCVIWVSSYCFYRMQYPINRLIHGNSDDEEETTDPTPSNGEVIYSSVTPNVVTQNGGQDLTDGQTNGSAVTVNGNGNISNGNKDLSHINGGNDEKVVYKNSTMERKTSLKKPPFADRSWSLKYRTIRNQFENASL